MQNNLFRFGEKVRFLMYGIGLWAAARAVAVFE